MFLMVVCAATTGLMMVKGVYEPGFYTRYISADHAELRDFLNSFVSMFYFMASGKPFTPEP